MIQRKLSQFDAMQEELNQRQNNDQLVAENQQLQERLNQFEGVPELSEALRHKGYLK